MDIPDAHDHSHGSDHSNGSDHSHGPMTTAMTTITRLIPMRTIPWGPTTLRRYNGIPKD